MPARAAYAAAAAEDDERELDRLVDVAEDRLDDAEDVLDDAEDEFEDYLNEADRVAFVFIVDEASFACSQFVELTVHFN